MEGAELLGQQIESPFRMAVRRFLRHRLALFSTILLLVIILLCAGRPLFSSYDPNYNDSSIKDQAPSREHIMGTDSIGRDIWARILDAGRISLFIAVVTVVLSETLGVVLGVVSGYFGGWVDALIMRIVDFILTLPLLPILLVVRTVLPPSISILIAILVLTSWTGSARLMRGQILSLREREYVEASRSLAASRTRVMFRHLVPNALAPIIVNASLSLSGVVILEAALSYLGFGVQPPQASWGNMLNGVSLTVLDRAPWQAFFPGLAIFLTSLCFNFIGDGLRDALDPRQKL